MRTGDKNILGKLQAPKIDQLTDNILLNAFDIAINGSLTQHGMIDGIRDAFVDESGIDTVNSLNESYNSTDDYYSPTAFQGGITTDTKLMIHANGGDESGQDHISTYFGTSKLEAGVYKIGNGSVELDGNSDYLSVPDHADWDLGTGNFTLESWIRWKVLPSGGTNRIINHGLELSNSLGEWEFAITESAGSFSIKLNIRQSSSWYNFSSGTFALTTEQWYHVAVVRSGTTIYGFLNGVQQGSTGTSADTMTSSTSMVLTVGAGGADSPAGTYLNGYMDEVRVSNTARWTSGFTPSTTKYTSDANTKLLLHLDDDFTDSGNTVHTVSGIGTARIRGAKFGEGCLWFDGNSDYITLPDSNDWTFAGNFTVEFWIKWTVLPGAFNYILGHVESYASDGWWINLWNNSGTYTWRFNQNDGGSTTIAVSKATSGLTAGEWFHIAFVRNGNDFQFYQDGSAVGTATTDSSAIVNHAGALYIGQSGGSSHWVNGTMDCIRISNIARYTTGFTPSSTVFTADANTKLLLNFEGGDQYGSHNVEPQGTAQVDRTTKKWGTGAWKFDGNSDYLELPDSADWDVVGSNSDNWTIDFWVKHTDHSGAEQYINQYEDGTNWWSLYHNDGNGIIFRVRSGGVDIIDTGSGAGEITDTDWHHVAMCKVADKYAIYKDGTQIVYLQDSSTDTFSGTLAIGAWNTNTNHFDGNMDEIRIQHSNYFTASPVVGLTDTITVPTDEYGTQTGTLAMTLIANSVTAEAEPDNARLVIFEEDVDSITLNTDLKAYISKDGGATWAQVTLENKGEYDTNKNILAGSVDLTASGIGSGTSMEYKLTTHNDKELKIHGMGELWD